MAKSKKPAAPKPKTPKKEAPRPSITGVVNLGRVVINVKKEHDSSGPKDVRTLLKLDAPRGTFATQVERNRVDESANSHSHFVWKAKAIDVGPDGEYLIVAINAKRPRLKTTKRKGFYADDPLVLDVTVPSGGGSVTYEVSISAFAGNYDPVGPVP
ncbi:MAG: hypothetical protein U0939_26030 [Pirellulales bacterium]